MFPQLVAGPIVNFAEVKNNLKMLESTWDNYQVYLNDEIDFIGEEPVLDYSLIKKEDEND